MAVGNVGALTSISGLGLFLLLIAANCAGLKTAASSDGLEISSASIGFDGASSELGLVAGDACVGLLDDLSGDWCTGDWTSSGVWFSGDCVAAGGELSTSGDWLT